MELYVFPRLNWHAAMKGRVIVERTKRKLEHCGQSAKLKTRLKGEMIFLIG